MIFLQSPPVTNIKGTLLTLWQGEIEESGITVAALFFKNVFGTTAERALSVFVALRSIHSFQYLLLTLTSAILLAVLLGYAIRVLCQLR